MTEKTEHVLTKSYKTGPASGRTGFVCSCGQSFWVWSDPRKPARCPDDPTYAAQPRPEGE